MANAGKSITCTVTGAHPRTLTPRYIRVFVANILRMFRVPFFNIIVAHHNHFRLAVRTGKSFSAVSTLTFRFIILNVASAMHSSKKFLTREKTYRGIDSTDT